MSFYSSTTRSKLVMLLISLVSLIAVGCGGSQEDYVFTNTNNGGAVGNVVFQFVNPQAATVPADTASFVFDFFNTTIPSNGTLIFSATASFANTVTVVGVPVEARSVVITAYDADGHPKATIFSTITVQPNVNNPADLSNATVETVTFDSISVSPADVSLILGSQDTTEQLAVTGNFSNGESLTFTATENAANADFLSSNPSVASVNASGLVTAGVVGTANIAVDYTVDGVTRSFTGGVDVTVTSGIADVLTVIPSTLTVAAGTSSGALSATLSIDGAQAADVTNDVDLSYALQAAVTGVSVNADTGVVTIAGGTNNGTTATVVATYDDGVNVATDTVVVTVGAPALLDVAFSEPTGTALELPFGGFQYDTEIIEYYADNTSVAGDPANYDFVSATPANGTVDTDGRVTTAAAGTTVITLQDGATVLDSFTLTSSDTEIVSSTIAPDTVILDINSTASYRLTVTYANARAEDVTAGSINNAYAVFNNVQNEEDVLLSFRGGTLTTDAVVGSGTYSLGFGGFTSVGYTSDTLTVTTNP